MSDKIAHWFWFPLPQRPEFPVAVVAEGMLPDQVDRVDSLWDSVRHDRAEVDVSGDAGYVEDLRKSSACPLMPENENYWLFEIISESARQVNSDNYGYEILGIVEPLQLAEYQVGEFFQWHMDFGGGRPSSRKLSVTIQLSDPESYEGGDLQFMANDKVVNAPRDRGAMIVFPSFVLHRVTPVTRGYRRSLVGWLSGRPFR